MIAVAIFVVLAMGRRESAFFSYKTLPEPASVVIMLAAHETVSASDVVRPTNKAKNAVIVTKAAITAYFTKRLIILFTAVERGYDVGNKT